MKRGLALFLLLAVLGCSQAYIDNPGKILEDPLSVNHQQALDQLESSYLRKEITYADYLQKKKQLEEDYDKAATARKDIIENNTAK